MLLLDPKYPNGQSISKQPSPADSTDLSMAGSSSITAQLHLVAQYKCRLLSPSNPKPTSHAQGQ